MSKISIELMPDGTVKVDCSQYDGSEAEILSLLEDLKTEVGGELTIEKHVHKHGHTHSHSHKIKV